MTSYIIRRLLYAIPIIFGVMLITFVLFNVVGGDRSAELAGKTASAETIAEIRHEYGWDKPLLINTEALRERSFSGLFDSQLFSHLKKCATLDFGKSIRDRRTVIEIIRDGVGASLSLTVPMFIISLFFSLAVSLFVAHLRGTRFDRTLVVLCVMGMSMPYLSYIMVGQYFLGYKLNWFPVFGYEPGFGAVKYLALPVLIGVISGLGSEVRMYRTIILDEVGSDYVRTARAKGLSTPKILFKHVLKNAMIPVITMVVLAIPFLFLGSLLLERFFGIPGLGYLMIEAIGSRDDPVISAMTFIGALLYVFGVIATDICYALVDPRVKLE